jgi:LmbE family N-acetylglucosaminyl deacetylase
MTTKPAQVMVVTPHPDDAEYGVAGTVARWAKEGKEIVYVVCTNGDKGTDNANMKPEEVAQIREKEQRAAANVLGVREVVFLGYPDQSLEDTPEFRKELVRVIRIYRPITVVTADPYRRYIWHRDHRITGQVTLDAICSILGVGRCQLPHRYHGHLPSEAGRTPLPRKPGWIHPAPKA